MIGAAKRVEPDAVLPDSEPPAASAGGRLSPEQVHHVLKDIGQDVDALFIQVLPQADTTLASESLHCCVQPWLNTNPVLTESQSTMKPALQVIFEAFSCSMPKRQRFTAADLCTGS